MRHKVERVAHQVAVEHRHGGGAGAVDQMGERGEVGLLTLVQRQGPGGFDQHLDLGQQARVVRQGVHPGFSEMRHGEVGGGLPRRVEQAWGVAVDEVERPHCLIVCGDGRSRRAGEVMSLGVLGHGRKTMPGVDGTVGTVRPPSPPRSCRGG